MSILYTLSVYEILSLDINIILVSLSLIFISPFKTLFVNLYKSKQYPMSRTRLRICGDSSFRGELPPDHGKSPLFAHRHARFWVAEGNWDGSMVGVRIKLVISVVDTTRSTRKHGGQH